MRLTQDTIRRKKVDAYDIIMPGLCNIIRCSTLRRNVIASKAGISNGHLTKCLKQNRFEPDVLLKVYKAIIEECNYNNSE